MWIFKQMKIWVQVWLVEQRSVSPAEQVSCTSKSSSSAHPVTKTPRMLNYLNYIPGRGPSSRCRWCSSFWFPIYGGNEVLARGLLRYFENFQIREEGCYRLSNMILIRDLERFFISFVTNVFICNSVFWSVRHSLIWYFWLP